MNSKTRNTTRRSRFITPTSRRRTKSRVAARKASGSPLTHRRILEAGMPKSDKLVVVDHNGNFLPAETAQFHGLKVIEGNPPVIAGISEESSELDTICDKIRAQKAEAARKRAEAKANGQKSEPKARKPVTPKAPKIAVVAVDVKDLVKGIKAKKVSARKANVAAKKAAAKTAPKKVATPRKLAPTKISSPRSTRSTTCRGKKAA